VHSYKKVISEVDIDVFGHLNHAHYFKICEEARWEWIRNKGVTLEKIFKRKQGFVILNAEIAYLKEIMAAQTIEIQTELREYTKKIFIIDQQIINANNPEIIHAKVVIKGGLFDMKARKLIEPDNFWSSVLL
jgi:YbgC/YbaW family acyl-CoA thioester hydrolase